MKVILIAALTVDGYIARSHDEQINWTSKEDKKSFAELTKQAGVVVMGSSTYRTIGKPLPGRRNIIYSRQKTQEEGIEFTDELPEVLIDRLTQEGHESVAICGGRSVYTLFLEAAVVDELYITVEPIIFGHGITLADGFLNLSLQLIEHKLINENSVLMHYEVKK